MHLQRCEIFVDKLYRIGYHKSSCILQKPTYILLGDVVPRPHTYTHKCIIIIIIYSSKCAHVHEYIM